MIKHGLQIFACNASRDLACDVSQRLGMRPGQLEISRFSNDNLRVQIQDNVRERDVFVLQSFTEPVSEHIMELMITLDALRSASAQRITAVIPYYSYARSDKKDAPRISITGRLIADLLHTAGADRVLTMDLHADQVHGFFSVPVDHLTAVSLIAEHFRNHYDLSNMVAVATDAGGAKRTGRFSEKLGIPMAIIDKRRVSDTAVKQGHVVGEVAGRDAHLGEEGRIGEHGVGGGRVRGEVVAGLDLHAGHCASAALQCWVHDEVCPGKEATWPQETRLGRAGSMV